MRSDIRISHYKANWMHGSDQWPEPTWPLKISERDNWDKQRLRTQQIDPWKALEAKGVGVHVGEWGAFNKTPHKVALAWMRDCLDLWKTAGWGCARCGIFAAPSVFWTAVARTLHMKICAATGSTGKCWNWCKVTSEQERVGGSSGKADVASYGF